MHARSLKRQCPRAAPLQNEPQACHKQDPMRSSKRRTIYDISSKWQRPTANATVPTREKTGHKVGHKQDPTSRVYAANHLRRNLGTPPGGPRRGSPTATLLCVLHKTNTRRNRARVYPPKTYLHFGSFNVTDTIRYHGKWAYLSPPLRPTTTGVETPSIILHTSQWMTPSSVDVLAAILDRHVVRTPAGRFGRSSCVSYSSRVATNVVLSVGSATKAQW